MALDRELGTTVRREHILQIIRALEGDVGSGSPIAITDVNDAVNPALTVRNKAANSTALKVLDNSGGTLFEVTSTGVTQTFGAGELNVGTGLVAPGFSMGGDTDTGFWHPDGATNSGKVGVVSQGEQIMQWSNTETTGYRQLALRGLGDNADGVIIAPTNTTSSAQLGPRLTLRSTAYSGGTVNSRDFMLRSTTTAADGTGKLDFVTRLNNGAETTILSISSAGVTSGVVQVQSHAASHAPTGADPLAVDAAAGTGSLRTLGTTSTSAAAGNHNHNSTARFALPPLAWMPSGAAAASFASINLGTSAADKYEWQFSGTATNTIFASLPLPLTWAGGSVKVSIYWRGLVTEATNNVVWQVGYSKYDISQSVNPTLTTTNNTSTYSGTLNLLHYTTFTFTIGATSTASMLDLAITRLGADASDTNANVVGMRMVTVELT